MKRLLSLVLTLALLGALALPAAAEEDSDARLAAVTLRVKETLGIDTQVYDQFYGDLTENELAPAWYLSWSGEAGSLEVTATEDGKILRYDRYDEDVSNRRDTLSLPEGDPVQAQAAAQAFLDRVLGEEESAELEPFDYGGWLGRTQYGYHGTVRLNGLPSPLSFSLSVRCSDNTVTWFYRDSLEGAYLGGIPAARFRTGAEAAKALLRDTLSLRLEYVRSEDGTAAVLRYLPNSTDEYYVDDVSGQLVDLTALYRGLGRGGSLLGDGNSAAPAESAAAMDIAKSLTQAEQTGVEKLTGALSKEELDQRARAVSELGLTAYALAAASYQVERAGADEDALPADAKVTAQLTYARQTDQGVWRRYVTLDAKTGGLESVSSSMPWREDCRAAVSEAEARKKAEAFLSKYRGELFGESVAYERDSGPAAWRIPDDAEPESWSFVYAQQVNGYFFPDNCLYAEIDSSDGSVSGFYQAWTEGIPFESPEGILGPQAALEAYLATFQLQGGYVAVPEKLDLSNPDYGPLAEMGFPYLSTLKLGYTLVSGGDPVLGIDAKTGEPVVYRYEEAAVQYGDLDAAPWAKSAVETLARYGVGYAGDSFAPTQALTQRDLVALLVSTRGYRVDPGALDDAGADDLYRTAYGMGLLTRAEREDGRPLTRLETAKLLLDAGGYGPAARLQGIYHTAFSDQADIPDGLLGYAALAQGLGMVRGDGSGRLNPNRTATRGEAAVMLYAFMGRAS